MKTRTMMLGMLLCCAAFVRAQDDTDLRLPVDSAAGALPDSVRLLTAQSDAQRARGEWRAAYNTLERAVTLRDSLLDAYNERVVAEMRSAHALDAKNAELEILASQQALTALALRLQQDSLAMQESALQRTETEATLMRLEAQRIARRRTMLERGHEAQSLELARRTAERNAVNARHTAAQTQGRALRAQQEHQQAIARRERGFRNVLIAGGLLLLVTVFLAIRRMQHRRIEAVLRTEIAEYQAGAVEEQTRAMAAMAERREKETLRAFSQRLIDTQEQERRRISSDLHDSLGQELTVIRNRASLALVAEPGSDEQHDHTEKLIAMAADAINEVRRISRDLRPYHIDQIGLSDTLRSMLDRTARSSGVAFTIHVDDVDHLLSDEHEINLYRLVQESVANILKHAQANTASVSLHRDGNTLFLVVRDDGRGFNPGDGQAQSPTSGGMGLKSMSERAEMMHGSLRIVSAPGEGTSFTAIIPLAAQAEHAVSLPAE